MVKKVKRFRHGKNLKKKWKQLKAKSHPTVNADVLKGFWDPKKSIAKNYMDLGLSYDPNLTIEIPKTMETQKHPEKLEVMSIEDAKALAQKNREEIKTAAVSKLMHDATLVGDKKHNLNENDRLMCIYMIEKYGEDYKKMARDHKNYYQDTPAQLKRRINIFKSMKQAYGKYLSDKAAGEDFLGQFAD